MYEVGDQVMSEIVRRLVAEFQPEEILLFGSQAWGVPGEDSDIDVMVIVSESDEKPARRATRAYRSLRGLDTAVDVLVRTRREYELSRRVHASLEARISEEGRSLYGRRQAGASTRMVAEGSA